MIIDNIIKIDDISILIMGMNIITELTKLDKTKVQYRGETIYIVKHELSSGIIKIFTDKRTLIILEEDFNPDDFLPINPISIVNPEVENIYLQKQDLPINTTIIGQNAGELTNIIMDNIRKVKEDPGYIAQAEAINSNVKTIIDIAKTQVDAFKVMKGV